MRRIDVNEDVYIQADREVDAEARWQDTQEQCRAAVAAYKAKQGEKPMARADRQAREFASIQAREGPSWIEYGEEVKRRMERDARFADLRRRVCVDAGLVGALAIFTAAAMLGILALAGWL